MLTRKGIVLLLLAGLVCACSAHRQPSKPKRRSAGRPGTYQDLVLAMDSAAIAALFTADGEIAADGQSPTRGPEAIRKHLETFKDYHVLAETLTTDTISIHGPAGHDLSPEGAPPLRRSRGSRRRLYGISG